MKMDLTLMAVLCEWEHGITVTCLPSYHTELLARLLLLIPVGSAMLLYAHHAEAFCCPPLQSTASGNDYLPGLHGVNLESECADHADMRMPVLCGRCSSSAFPDLP